METAKHTVTLINWDNNGPILRLTNDRGHIARLHLTTQAELDNAVFPGCWQDAADGEEYISSWAALAEDEYDREYVVTWWFDLVKGDEPEPDELPWDDMSCIRSIRPA